MQLLKEILVGFVMRVAGAPTPATAYPHAAQDREG
jgi:hypothetical protein